MLTIPLDKLAFIIGKAKEFDAEVPGDFDLSGSDPGDDDEAEILFDTEENPTEEELRGAIDSLNVDELADLVALAWLGRGDFEPREWGRARGDARRVLTRSEWRYLMGMPMLGDFLEEGAEALGLTVSEAVVALH
jgi:hypothetical protein